MKTLSWKPILSNLAEALGEIKTLTEMEFAKRMHRIYAALNNAWNNRNGKTLAPVNDLFPSIFATGCHNMWRK